MSPRCAVALFVAVVWLIWLGGTLWSWWARERAASRAEEQRCAEPRYILPEFDPDVLEGD